MKVSRKDGVRCRTRQESRNEEGCVDEGLCEICVDEIYHMVILKGGEYAYARLRFHSLEKKVK